MGSSGGSDGPDVHLQKLLELDTDHLYRHLTEVNGKDTRGGYIEGRLEFDPQLLQSPFGLKITLVSDVNPKTAASGRVHPNLIYMTRFEGGKRKRDLEAATPLWRIELEIRNGEVYWWTESEAQALYAQRLGVQLQPSPSTGLRSVLELRDLRLTVITPLVRTNVNGIKVGDGLAMRKPLFESLEEHEWEEVLRKLNKFYTNKENKSEMDKVCLQFALHRILREDCGDKEEMEPMCPVLYSQPICNSKSRSLGILELIPDMVSCQKACTRRRRTVFLLSKFQLVSEKEVFPRLVVRRGEEWRVDPRIRQPIETTVVANRLFVFVMPEQEEDAIAEIYREGGKVFLDAYRPRDKTSSNVKLEMELKVHNGPGEVCSLCIEDPDKISGRPSGDESLQQRLAATGTARPGVKRRRRENVNNSISTTESPQREHTSSPSSSHLSPEQQLFHEIDGLEVDGSGPGAGGGWDLEDLHSLGMPDVLRGVVGREAPGAPSPDYLSLGAPSDNYLCAPSIVEPMAGAENLAAELAVQRLIPSSPYRAQRSNEQNEYQYPASLVDSEEPPGCSYMAESASLASSDLVDISPLDSAAGNVESASLLSWPTPGGMDEEEEEEEEEMDERPEEMHCDGLSLSSSSSSSIQRVTLAKRRMRHNGSAPCFMVLPKEEKEMLGDPKVERQKEERVATIDLISRINCVQESLVKVDEPLHEDLPEHNGAAQREARVMEMAKKFGGAKQKCMQRIRSNLQMGKAKEGLGEGGQNGDLPDRRREKTEKEEKHQPDVVGEEQQRMNRSGCLPAIIYLTTPILVTFFAWILHCWFGVVSNSSSSLAAEE